ncbi:hypothetical protein DPEC_G00169520 [Dallia pectoralis]|uniref:Uncharacterized protein n=1 Tax=Dallia pectoralis TaxID=75939 RepID=A0ACC2GD19_DALPE|nr:hypothetical protein DPEC_G00169520 [Dallia pectoralis]
MSDSKSLGTGVPAQRSSQSPEMVMVKLEDCGQPLVLNVIVKEEEQETGIDERGIINKLKQEVDELTVKEEDLGNREEDVEVGGNINLGGSPITVELERETSQRGQIFNT